MKKADPSDHWILSFSATPIPDSKRSYHIAEIMTTDDKNRAVVVDHQHHPEQEQPPQYGTFQGVANYPPPPPTGFPQPVPPPGASEPYPPPYHSHGYQTVQGTNKITLRSILLWTDNSFQEIQREMKEFRFSVLILLWPRLIKLIER